MHAHFSQPGTPSVLNRALDWVFPRICLICGDISSEQIDICSNCEEFLSVIPIFCPICGIQSKKPLICGTCQKTSPHFDVTYSGFDYTAPVDSFIKRLKYGKQLDFARTLGELMSARLVALGAPLPDLIIPVPLHRERLRERGFNQSLEIARVIAKSLNRKIDSASVARIKPTPPQADLPLKKRRANVRNAFKVYKPLTASHVAILDDVMTTGSTADELARCLKRSGIKRVDVWTVTRAG